MGSLKGGEVHEVPMILLVGAIKVGVVSAIGEMPKPKNQPTEVAIGILSTVPGSVPVGISFVPAGIPIVGVVPVAMRLANRRAPVTELEVAANGVAMLHLPV